jgi:hypothetical protein
VACSSPQRAPQGRRRASSWPIGWAGEITHFIADFARMFSAAGHRRGCLRPSGWGRSDAAAGKPRHESEPWEQIRDYQHAITYAQNRQNVDAQGRPLGNGQKQATLTLLRETMANARRQLSAEDTQGRCCRFTKLTGPSILGPEFVVTVER